MEIHVFNNQADLPIKASKIRRIVEAVVEFEGQRFNEAAVHFVSTEEISSLHGQYFGDPSPTDCMSFPIDLDSPESSWRIMGDVFVCPRTAIEYCKENGGDPRQETVLYVVHGLLHLMGYDDIEEKDEQAMRRAEGRQIENLKKLSLCDTE